MTVPVLFWDVDTQRDFMDEEGKLSVPGAQSIVRNLKRLTDFAVRHRLPIVASVDAHHPDDVEFRQFGEHCVAGTPGQEKIPQTSAAGSEVAQAGVLQEQVRRLAAAELPQLIIEKPVLDVFAVPLAEDALRALAPARAFVYGVATEYCVARTVLGIARRGYAVTVVEDAIKAIGEAAGQEAIADMRQAGAELVSTDTALRLASTPARTRRRPRARG